MNIVVVMKMVPDVVEELQVASDGKSLDLEFLRMIVNERDDHALEQGLILKERLGDAVVVVALESPEIDYVLYTALAKGADRAVKLVDLEPGLTSRAQALVLAQTLPLIPDLLPARLVLTGCQAIDDLDAQAAAFIANRLDLPYVGVVSRAEVDVEAGLAKVSKEFPGSVRGEFEVCLPAVLGIQAAEKPPRYVRVVKVREAMKSREIETVSAPASAGPPRVTVLEMTEPQVAAHAEMLDGAPEEVAVKICEILATRGLL